MKTAIDARVFLDVLRADRRHGEPSRRALGLAFRSGALVASAPVWAEIFAAFADTRALEKAIGRIGLTYDPISREAARLAGEAWRRAKEKRRRSGGVSPSLGSFLVGAHALLQADLLLARDARLYRQHFPRLRIVDPIADRP